MEKREGKRRNRKTGRKKVIDKKKNEEGRFS